MGTIVLVAVCVAGMVAGLQDRDLEWRSSIGYVPSEAGAASRVLPGLSSGVCHSSQDRMECCWLGWSCAPWRAKSSCLSSPSFPACCLGARVPERKSPPLSPRSRILAASSGPGQLKKMSSSCASYLHLWSSQASFL